MSGHFLISSAYFCTNMYNYLGIVSCPVQVSDILKLIIHCPNFESHWAEQKYGRNDTYICLYYFLFLIPIEKVLVGCNDIDII